MNRRFVSSLIYLLVCAAFVAATAWLWVYGLPAPTKSSPPPIPATVSKPLKEDQINTVTLTAAAVERLAIATAKVERKSVRRARVYGGEAIVPPGGTIVVAAPLGGTLRAPATGAIRAGQILEPGQTVFELLPMFAPEGRVNLATARIDADGQIEIARTQREAASIALDRAKRLLKSDTGTRRGVDDAQAQVDIAQKTLDAAVARRELLMQAMREVDQGQVGPLPLTAPSRGWLRTVFAAPGQLVPAGANLFEIMNLDRVWIRVPVAVGDLAGLDTQQVATITELSAKPGTVGREARPVAAPPTANSTAGTVDLFYELDNRETNFRPGQRLGVNLKLNDDEESLTVPWSAVIHDIHGGTWVYEQTGERVYQRSRVTIRYVLGDTAVMAAGPVAGTAVVVAGAAELFGTETGFSK